jgi:hypothetical protein
MYCIQYRIDKDDRITSVDQKWDEFAEANQAAAIRGHDIVEQRLFDFIEGWECQQIYRTLFRQVRVRQQSAEFGFRCDAPDRRRFMSMRLDPLPESGIELNSYLVREERRDPLRLLDARIPRSRELLEMCSWCKKVLLSPMQWVEPEEAVRQLDLFAADSLPKISHGMCPACFHSRQPPAASPVR